MQIKAIKSVKTGIKTNKRKRRALLFSLGLFLYPQRAKDQRRARLGLGHPQQLSGRGSILNGCKLFAYYYIYMVCKRRALFFILGTSKDQRQNFRNGKRHGLGSAAKDQRQRISGGHVWGWGCGSSGRQQIPPQLTPRRTQGQFSVAAAVRAFQSTPFMFQKYRF